MSGEERKEETPQQGVVWERVPFENAFDWVFSNLVDVDALWYLYLKLEKIIINGSALLDRSIGSFDIIFELAHKILEEGTSSSLSSLRESYVNALKTLIKAVYMRNDEKTEVVADEISSAASSLATAIKDLIKATITKTECEDS